MAKANAVLVWLTGLAVLIAHSAFGEEPASLAHRLQFCTIRIEVTKADGGHTGTGFFFSFATAGKTSSIPTIVTCKHLIEGATTGRLFFSRVDSNVLDQAGQPATVEVVNFERMWVLHPDTNIDLCAMPIAQVLRESEQHGIYLRFAPLDESLMSKHEPDPDLDVLQQIVLIGYPIGIWDAANNFPISRQGIAATDPNQNYNGKPEFLIDAACFPGSSGSPVFQFNEGAYLTKGHLMGGSRLRLLGVLYAGPQYTAEGTLVVRSIPTALEQRSTTNTVTRIPTNLGIVIKARALLEFEKVFEKLTPPAKK